MLPQTTIINGYDYSKPKKLFGSPFATSTPSGEHKLHNGHHNYASLKKLGEREHNYVGVCLVGLVVAIILGKLLLLTMDLESISIKDAAIHSWRYSKAAAADAYERNWEKLQSTEVDFRSILVYAVLGGLLTLFSWTMVYLDSDVPGVNPPTPFSPRQNRTGYQQHVKNSYSLAYLMTVVNGVAVFVYLLCN